MNLIMSIKSPIQVFLLTSFDPRRARTNQIADMMAAFGYATVCESVLLVAPPIHMPGRLNASQVFLNYGLPEIFSIKYLPTSLSDDTSPLQRNSFFILIHISFAVKLFFQILFSRSKCDVRKVVISRDPNLLIPYLILRKVLGKLFPITIASWLHEIVNKRRHIWVYQQSDICLATNQTIVEDVIAGFQVDPSNCLVVSNPIPEKYLCNETPDKVGIRRRLGLPESKPLVVYTGKLFRGQMEAHYLLNVAAILPHVAFLFTGGKPDVIAYFRTNCLQRNLTNVMFTGFLDDYTAVRDYQLAADVLVSYYSTRDHNVRHNFPNKLLEYMSTGNVVVTADNPALRPFCHDGNVVLVEPENPSALADALERILTDPERRLALTQAARRTAQEWTVEQVAKRAVDFILNQTVDR
jgi:glycosyltransferase involved in cell wall biosynthesis